MHAQNTVEQLGYMLVSLTYNFIDVRACKGDIDLHPRFPFSARFRRNSGKNFVSASYREEKFRYFSVNFVSKFKNSKKFVKKYDKKLGAFLSE